MAFEDDAPCQVLANLSGRYSLWPLNHAIPDGWRAIGFSGPKADCMAYVDKVWTNILTQDRPTPSA